MSEEMDAINQLPIASVYMYIYKVIEYGSARKRGGYACEKTLAKNTERAWWLIW